MPDPPLYLKGAEVHVFHDWKRTGGWFPTATHADGRHPPRKGFTHGWVRATVAEDWHEGRFNALDKSTWVALEPRAPLWYNRDGALWGGPQPPCARAHPRDVRSREPSLRMSVFVVRWGGPAPAFDPDSWGPTGSVVSDLFVDSMLDDVAGPAVYPEAEVYTAFVTCSEDLRRLDPPVLRGRHRCAMYFLYPCEFRDSVCAPAYVNKNDFFALVRRAERCGLPSRFPHASHLYELLLSKSWAAHLCTSPRFHLPLTTRAATALIVRDAPTAARAALRALHALRPPGSEPVAEGVVKLGYSWEAMDVRAFTGPAQLAQQMAELVLQSGCEADYVFVQERVATDLEMRLMVVDGAVRHTLFSRFGRVRGHVFADFEWLTDRDAVATAWLDGDRAALAHAERVAQRLVGRWVHWLRTEGADAAPGFRLDLLVCRVGPGRARVYTGELGELGFSMLSWDAGPKVVTEAVLRAAFRDCVCGVAGCGCDADRGGDERRPKRARAGP